MRRQRGGKGGEIEGSTTAAPTALATAATPTTTTSLARRCARKRWEGLLSRDVTIAGRLTLAFTALAALATLTLALSTALAAGALTAATAATARWRRARQAGEGRVIAKAGSRHARRP